MQTEKMADSNSLRTTVYPQLYHYSTTRSVTTDYNFFKWVIFTKKCYSASHLFNLKWKSLSQLATSPSTRSPRTSGLALSLYSCQRLFFFFFLFFSFLFLSLSPFWVSCCCLVCTCTFFLMEKTHHSACSRKNLKWKCLSTGKEVKVAIWQ